MPRDHEEHVDGGNMLNFEDMPKELLKEMTELFNQECAKRFALLP